MENRSIYARKTPIFNVGKIPPQEIEIEKAVLGAIMIEKDSLLDVIDILNINSFYLDNHKEIYKAIIQINERSESIDILTVSNQLKTNGKLELIGGDYYIAQLTNRISSSANIEFHARIIKQKQIARELISLGTDVIKNAYDNTKDVISVLDNLLNDVYEIGDIQESGKSFSNTELLRELKNDIQNAKTLQGITGLTTGIQKKDQLFGGYQKTHLIIKAGRPAMGKSADALCEAEHIATELNKNVLFFSLEMSSKELTMRRVSVSTEITLNKLRGGYMTSDDWKYYNEVTSKMMTNNLRIVDTPGISLNSIRKIAKKHAIKYGLDIIFVDYLQLIEHKVQGANREQEISAISRGLKKLAKELDVPVVCLSQLSRAVETRGGNKKPILSDLRESGAIEQDADIVQFLYRPEYYGINEDESGESTVGKGYCIVAKNRHGACKDIPMRFIPELTKFEDWKDYTEINNNNIPTGKDFSHIPTSSQDNKEDDVAL